MSAGDIKIVDLGGRNVSPVRRFVTESAETAINPGEPVVISNTNVYVIAAVDADGVCYADYFVGIAAKVSSHSASADGYVDVYLDLPGVIYAAKPKTAGSCNTQAKIDALMFKRVILDLTASKYTVDTANAGGVTQSIMIMGGNPDQDECYFAVCDQGTWRNYGHG